MNQADREIAARFLAIEDYRDWETLSEDHRNAYLTSKKITPAIRRFAGIRAIFDRYVTGGKPHGTREEFATMIRETLPQLGRTDRWKGTVEGWALLVEDTDHDLDWAVPQGGLYVGWEAE